MSDKHSLIKFLNDHDISLGFSNDTTELRPAADKGFGRFATQDIAEDDPIYWAGGMWLTDKEKDYYEQDYFQLVGDNWYFQGGLKYYLNGCHNHSCEPNAYLQDNIVRALRNITKDEQVTIDYASFISHEYTILSDCKCNSKDCRNHITGNDWRLYNLPLKYNYRVSSYILRTWLLSQKN